jgi:predicted GH43/DUF377 family glycosyl hydrolase
MRAAALALGLCACEPEYGIVAPVDVHPGDVTECAFEPVEDAPGFERYTCNPVFTATGEDWAEDLSAAAFGTTQVLGHPFYQLWYFAETDDGPRSGYATSADGTSWEPHPDNPTWPQRRRDAWDGGRVFNTDIAWDPRLGAYVMLYAGVSTGFDTFGLGVATSADGWHWALAPSNPVIDLSLRFGGTQLAWPLTLEMSKRGEPTALIGATEDGDHIAAWRFETDDVTAWTQPGEEVFGPGRSGDFDDQGLVDAAVAEIDGVQHMFYVGFGDWRVVEGTVRESSAQFLGHATSADEGRSWERESREPVPLHLDQDGKITAVAAHTVGPRILLWVTDWYAEHDAFGVGYFVYTP